MKILAVDIGGTSIKTAIVNFNSDQIELKDKQKTLFDNTNPRESIIKAVSKYQDEQYDYVGISATGIIDENGVVVASNGKIDNYCGLNLNQIITDNFSKPAKTINDVAAIGYAQLLHITDDDIHLVVALGTGIGGSLIYKQQVIAGTSPAFAEIGQIQIGNKTYEELASTKALITSANVNYKIDVENGEQFFKLLIAGDKLCAKCFDKWVEYIATGLQYCLYFYNPKSIILAGGVSEQDKLIIPRIYEHLQSMQGVYINNLKITSAENKNDAGLIGAALNIRRNV